MPNSNPGDVQGALGQTQTLLSQLRGRPQVKVLRQMSPAPPLLLPALTQVLCPPSELSATVSSKLVQP